ncbi:F0F1 ATP synthase subunit A [Candidatus Saccharibacteria bacterium]|nr:F0F1 ATP synthase subunit A [Candidatus Saccharibacteria bacterium]
MHISIKAEPVFEIFGFDITNSMLLGVIGYIILLIWLIRVAHSVREDNQKKKGFFVRLAIWCFTGLYNTCREIIPNERICRIIAPFAITLFFYIGVQYYVELLPFVGEVVTIDGTSFFRGPVADLGLTFALAITAIVLIQIVATIKHGFKGNAGRYFRNPFKNPIGFFEGLLELVSEFSRLISLSMRLFGNVLAGEILIIIVSWLTGYASPALLPFVYIFEMFIGGIQAYVFFSLTVVFSGIAVADSEEKEENPKNKHKQKLNA